MFRDEESTVHVVDIEAKDRGWDLLNQGLSVSATAANAAQQRGQEMKFGGALSVADINGDGIPDLIITAPQAHSTGEIRRGSFYVVLLREMYLPLYPNYLGAVPLSDQTTTSINYLDLGAVTCFTAGRHFAVGDKADCVPLDPEFLPPGPLGSSVEIVSHHPRPEFRVLIAFEETDSQTADRTMERNRLVLFSFRLQDWKGAGIDINRRTVDRLGMSLTQVSNLLISPSGLVPRFPLSFLTPIPAGWTGGGHPAGQAVLSSQNIRRLGASGRTVSLMLDLKRLGNAAKENPGSFSSTSTKALALLSESDLVQADCGGVCNVDVTLQAYMEPDSADPHRYPLTYWGAQSRCDTEVLNRIIGGYWEDHGRSLLTLSSRLDGLEYNEAETFLFFPYILRGARLNIIAPVLQIDLNDEETESSVCDVVAASSSSSAFSTCGTFPPTFGLPGRYPTLTDSNLLSEPQAVSVSLQVAGARSSFTTVHHATSCSTSQCLPTCPRRMALPCLFNGSGKP